MQFPFTATLRMSASQRCAAAYHEAGHAVAAWRLSWLIAHVSIMDDVDADGLARGGHIQIVKRRNQPGFGDLVDRMIFTLAGPAAQRRFAPRSRVRASGIADFLQVDRLARIHCRTAPSERSLKRCADLEAKALVANSWPMIEAVATALLSRSVLTGSDVTRIIESIEDAMASAWQVHLAEHGIPTTADLEQHELKRNTRKVSARDIAVAAFTVLLRNTVAGLRTNLADPFFVDAIVDVASCRGLPPNQVRDKIGQLLAARSKAMQWRPVTMNFLPHADAR